ncbi:hypothetical protein [Streptomyces aureus]
MAAEVRLVHPLRQEARSGLRSQNEGGNGNLEKSALDNIDNPQFRLPHGRVAQTPLKAVIILVAHLSATERFRGDQGIQQVRGAAPGQPAHRPLPSRSRSPKAQGTTKNR